MFTAIAGVVGMIGNYTAIELKKAQTGGEDYQLTVEQKQNQLNAALLQKDEATQQKKLLEASVFVLLLLIIFLFFSISKRQNLTKNAK